MEIDLPSPQRSLWRLQPPPPAGILALAKKKAEKKIEEVISRPCVSDEGCAGNPGRHALWRQPGETVKALPGRPGRAGCGLPGAPKLPKAHAPEARSSCRTKLHMMRGRCGRTTSFGPGAWMARLGRKSCVGRAVVFAVGAKGSHNQKPPPGPPPTHCFPARYFPPLSAHFCPLLLGIARLVGA